MRDFQQSLKVIHPNKTNTIMLSIIVILILIVGIQVWMLYTAVNNALEAHKGIAFPAFIASTILFLAGCRLLFFLPPKTKQ